MEEGIRRLGEGVEDVPSLFFCSGEDRADCDEGLGASVSAEAAGDFLLEFHHAVTAHLGTNISEQREVGKSAVRGKALELYELRPCRLPASSPVRCGVVGVG
jgi:hypothetical protein